MQATAVRHPENRAGEDAESRLNIVVVFTKVDSTLAALRKAGSLANSLGARITLVVPEVVSYQLPLNQPPVMHDWNRRRFRVLAENSPVETSVRFYLCRDRDETLAKMLKPHSLVVIGTKRRWWPTSEGRLAKKLQKAGLEIILVETE
jgi:hypothetical protein